MLPLILKQTHRSPSQICHQDTTQGIHWVQAPIQCDIDDVIENEYYSNLWIMVNIGAINEFQSPVLTERASSMYLNLLSGVGSFSGPHSWPQNPELNLLSELIRIPSYQRYELFISCPLIGRLLFDIPGAICRLELIKAGKGSGILGIVCPNITSKISISGEPRPWNGWSPCSVRIVFPHAFIFCFESR